jgi:biopolymer transport protein ExbD
MASVGTDSKEALTLNIMPLLDIFSILILFLLMSFSSDPISHDVNPGIELPDSQTLTALDEVPTIIVTKTGILVGDRQKNVASIINGDVPERFRHQGAIQPLYDELLKLSEANKGFEKKAGAEEKPTEGGTLTIEMDKEHPFKLMRRIMLSAQQADFFSFKLMVARESN